MDPGGRPVRPGQQIDALLAKAPPADAPLLDALARAAGSA